MKLRLNGRTGRRVRLALIVVALLAAAVAGLLASALVPPAIALALTLLVWDRARLAADVRALAAAVADAGPEAKLEVAEGPWGELCYALNRLIQQRRAEDQVRELFPFLSPASAARFVDAPPPPEGVICEVAVLAVGRPATPEDPVGHLREVAYAALHQAQLYDALLTRSGERIILIFGTSGAPGLAAALHRAHQAAHAIRRPSIHAPQLQRPRIALTCGPARIVILPGLGLSAVGAPIERAIELQGIAAGDLLVCSEEAYLGLRRMGVIAAAPTVRLSVAGGGPPAFGLPNPSSA